MASWMTIDSDCEKDPEPINCLRRLCEHLAAESYRMHTTDINYGKASLGYQPPPLTSTYAAVNKDQLVATRCTRFAKYSL